MGIERVMLKGQTNAPAHPTAAAFQRLPREFSTDLAVFSAPDSDFHFRSIDLHSTTPSGNLPQPAPISLQRKLEIGPVDDPLEREADETAERVMRMAEPTCDGPTMDSSQRIQRKCDACKEEENRDDRLARKPLCVSATVKSASVPPIVYRVLGQAGHPLDHTTRAFLEPRFGCDLTSIRVHTDSTAAESARAVHATAWTVGKDIAFASGQYVPGTSAGRLLLAHELTHSIQQGAALPNEKVARGRSESGQQLMLRRQPAPDPRKLEVERVVEPRRIKIGEWLSSVDENGVPRLDEQYWVEFEVSEDGVMEASVRTVLPGGKYRSATLRYGEEFRNAIKHFEANKIRVTAYDADWSYMDADEISENLRAFKEGIAEGLTREQAAGRTPCGRVAKRCGFEVTHVENVLESQEHLAEQGIRRWRVKAMFRPLPEPGSTPIQSGHNVRPLTSPVNGPNATASSEPTALSEPTLTVESPSAPTVAETEVRGGMLGAEARAGATLGEAAVDAVKAFAVDTIVAAVVLELLSLARAWLTYEKNVESREERLLRELFEKKVTPGMRKALAGHAREAEQLNTRNPEFPIYANVTVDMDESYTSSGIAGVESGKAINDARFVGLDVSFKKISKDEVIHTDYSSPLFSGITTHYSTRRITYPVEINFGETPAQHRWRSLLHQAGQAAERHLSARAVAGHTHFGGGSLSAAEEREERQRAKTGEPSLVKQKAQEEQKLWVRAYIEYTALHGPDDLYADALKYLSELENAEVPGRHGPFSIAPH